MSCVKRGLNGYVLRCQRRPLDSGSDVSSSRKVKNMADAECGPEATSGSDRQMAFRDKRKRKKGNTSAPESHPDDPETVSVTSCLLVMLIFVLGKVNAQQLRGF